MDNRINKDITGCQSVRLIGENGEQLGIQKISDAMNAAYELGLDLVEVSPNASPPVCKIMNFGKHKYEETKKRQEARRSQSIGKLKELRLKPNISGHDLSTKVSQIREFLEKKNKVRVECYFKGREITMMGSGNALLSKVFEQLSDVATFDQQIKSEGHKVAMVLVPK